MAPRRPREFADLPRDQVPLAAADMYNRLLKAHPDDDAAIVAVALLASIDPPTRRLDDARYGMAARAIVTAAWAAAVRRSAERNAS